MTRKSEDKIIKPGAVELTESELGEAAGGEGTYANNFTCIPDTVGTADSSQTDPQIADVKLSSPTLKRGLK